MTLQEKIQAYNQAKKDLEKQAKDLKSDFEKYLVNKNIPLVERWEFFVNSDEGFKNHKRSIHRANSEGMQYVMDNWFNAPEVYGRGKRIDVADLFGDCVHNGNIYPENFSYKMQKEDAQELLEEALEEILNNNLGSFCFDW